MAVTAKDGEEMNLSEIAQLKTHSERLLNPSGNVTFFCAISERFISSPYLAVTAILKFNYTKK